MLMSISSDREAIRRSTKRGESMSFLNVEKGERKEALVRDGGYRGE